MYLTHNIGNASAFPIIGNASAFPIIRLCQPSRNARTFTNWLLMCENEEIETLQPLVVIKAILKSNEQLRHWRE